MDPERVSAGMPPRIGLVLGAGGVLGAAWMAGALAALQERLPRPVSDVDIVVGTSAGSVLAAALRCGIKAEEIVAHQRGDAPPELAALGPPDIGGGPWPPPPRLRVGSPRLMFASLRTPHRMSPWVAASALLPQGRGRHGALHAMVHALVSHARHTQGPHGWQPDWAADGRTWIVAVDYDSGRRVVFGREGSPPATLPDAVVASCSIPGWYRPAQIGGRRYVDGGVRSATSAAVLARAGLDHVYILAPLACMVTDRPRKPHERIERRIRRLITFNLRREVHTLRSHGTEVTVLTPGPEDLAAMGINPMDPRRRQTVLETSLRTSAAALTAPEPGRTNAA
ncbi:MAG: patatin-like phospholipase family protein [Micromonosporaceae bacterium]